VTARGQWNGVAGVLHCALVWYAGTGAG
jgi:hypothetical protein